MKTIKISNITKKYDDITILNNISLDIQPNTINAIVGPNGCGKSTLLNILAGIDKEYSGEHNLQDNVSYIFQNYRDSLMPWRNNYKNLSLPLELKNISKEEISKKINELQKIFQLDIDMKKYPYQLSGGQQQQLAFIRALVNDPKLLFIDEPFSALDYETNLKLRDGLQRYQKLYKPTIFLITHNIEEATHLADKIIVLSKRPTKITNIIENKRTSHRTTDYLKTPEFNKVKNKVLNAFENAIISDMQ
jgi:NitT/TauT family transport system ATP-binding protein